MKYIVKHSVMGGISVNSEHYTSYQLQIKRNAHFISDIWRFKWLAVQHCMRKQGEEDPTRTRWKKGCVGSGDVEITEKQRSREAKSILPKIQRDLSHCATIQLVRLWRTKGGG